VVDEVDRPLDLVVGCDVEVAELEVLAAQVRDVLEGAGLEVVDADDLVAPVDQVVAEVRPEKTRPPMR